MDKDELFIAFLKHYKIMSSYSKLYKKYIGDINELTETSSNKWIDIVVHQMKLKNHRGCTISQWCKLNTRWKITDRNNVIFK